jgi:predicted nucleic acid-binding protein
MPANAFLDTSVLLYVIAEDDPRAEIAEALLAEGGVISAQVLNEFVSVARRKYRMDWEEIEAVIDDIRLLCAPVVPVTVETHESGVHLAKRYGYRIYDALLLAAATQAGCTTLYSEDMQHGQTIGSLSIRNPFLPG